MVSNQKKPSNPKDLDLIRNMIRQHKRNDLAFAGLGMFVIASLTITLIILFLDLVLDGYPKFTLDWMNSIELWDKGNVLINIRENISDGILSDYILKTRLFLRENAWKEIDELIWIKPDSMPVGNNKRPRRSWERVLWFSNHNQPIVYPKHNGKPSKRIGLPKEQTGKKPFTNINLVRI